MSVSPREGMTPYTFDAGALLEKAEKLGCDQAEVYESGTLSTPVHFENNQLKSMETSETAIAAVRVIKNGRMGFATSSKAGDDSVVDMAARGAEFGPEATFDFVASAPVDVGLETYDPAVAGWDQEKMLAAGEELVDHIRSLEAGVLGRATVEKHVAYARLATSRGQNVCGDGTAFVVLGMGELVEPENMIHVWTFAAGRRLDLDLEAAKARLGTMFQRARRNVPFSAGRFPVVFAPMAATDLISPMLACVNGMAVAKGESPWRDKLGEKLFSQAFSLYDDPTLPWGLRTCPFDDEGTPTSRRSIIEKGVLKDFLLDRRAGKALGRESTSNGYRPSPQALPVPGPSNVIIPPGETPLADLVSGVREGLYVERLMGAWAGNPYAGQVSGNVHIGFKIEDGEITGRVKDCMVSISVFEAFRDSLTALSRETEDVPLGMRFPFVLLDGMSVSTKV